MFCGAVPVVRGSAAGQGLAGEQAFIMRHAECKALVIQDAQAWARLQPELERSGEVSGVVRRPCTRCAVAAQGGRRLRDHTHRCTWPFCAAHQQAAALKCVILIWGESSNSSSSAEAGHAAGQPQQSMTWPPSSSLRAQQASPVACASLTATWPHRCMGHGAVWCAQRQPRSAAPLSPTTAAARAQVNNLGFFLQVTPGDTCLSLLPPSHI